MNLTATEQEWMDEREPQASDCIGILRDLMGDPLDDQSARNEQLYDGVVGDAGRALKATTPWQPSLVRLGQRERQHPATTYRDVNPNGTFRRRGKLAEGQAIVDRIQSERGGEPFKTPEMGCGPGVLVGNGFQRRIPPPKAPTRFSTYDAASATWTTYRWTDQSQGWMPGEPCNTREESERSGDSWAAMFPLALDDTVATVPMGRNRALEAQADAWLGDTGDLARAWDTMLSD